MSVAPTGVLQSLGVGSGLDVNGIVTVSAQDQATGRSQSMVIHASGGLSQADVGRLVALHADAKRYLVATDPTYRSRLSARSLETLVEQGGVVDEHDVTAFSEIADLDAVLALRRADDDAKVPGRTVAGLDTWRPTLEHLAHGSP